MKVPAAERDLIFALLQEHGTVGELSLFLKIKGLHYSASSWDEMLRGRISKYLDEEKLVRADLVEMLRMSEEHGSQHIFLYQAQSVRAARTIADQKRVISILEGLGLAFLIQEPRILDKPRTPTITDVRWERGKQLESLVLKVVTQRQYRRFVDERSEGDYFIRRYRGVNVRAVNLFRLLSDGFLELRISSHENSSDYRADLAAMWNMMELILPRRDFKELPILKAKNNLWSSREKLKSILRYSDSSLRNPQGTVLSAATGAEQMSLFDDVGASRSLDEFLKYDAYCDSSNVWWLKGNAPKNIASLVVPSKDVHVFLSGAPHEFALTAKCSKQDYEYVLDQIRRNNR
jgi:hypothetical protein